MMAVLIAQQAINAVALGGVSGQKGRAIRKDLGLDFPWTLQRTGRRHQMSSRGTERDCIAQKSIQRNLVPARDFERIHMVDHG